ncbi:DUF397 domain-containing protein [Nonomuraea wenchangensis]|jgi:hypothetical protein|uniref:DUF397 domain-containing protein n=1 Tax=Nonomuraea wenchangensis TaxID=568860 RepID=A0A1I0JTK6_9ACTN|nr:DUF397 domain-containing protein [Nonomuraea wenchangensis]SEU14037.1 protein of unknown function [Nonomuraea wenchangensis]
MIDLSQAEFRKSSYSGSGNNCVEVATNLPGVVVVRDSKDPDGPKLVFSRAEFEAFITAVKSDHFG